MGEHSLGHGPDSTEAPRLGRPGACCVGTHTTCTQRILSPFLLPPSTGLQGRASPGRVDGGRGREAALLHVLEGEGTYNPSQPHNTNDHHGDHRLHRS